MGVRECDNVVGRRVSRIINIYLNHKKLILETLSCLLIICNVLTYIIFIGSINKFPPFDKQ